MLPRTSAEDYERSLSVSPKFEYFLSDGNSWAKLKVGFVSVQWQQKNRFRAGGGVAKKTLLS